MYNTSLHHLIAFRAHLDPHLSSATPAAGPPTMEAASVAGILGRLSTSASCVVRR